MHSPDHTGPAMAMRRPDFHRHVDPEIPARQPSSKILQSLLYNFAQSGYLTNVPAENGRDVNVRPPRLDYIPSQEADRTRDTAQPSAECVRNRRGNNDMAAPVQRQHPYRQLPHPPVLDPAGHVYPRGGYQNQSATMTPPGRGRDGAPGYTESYLSPRHRSSSIGSAGSSFRDSRSPSHDSTASHDSLSRCSPLSISSSPSPSPPTIERNSSKLFGILKGASYSAPYGTLPSRASSQQDPTHLQPSASHRRLSLTSNHSNSSHNSTRNLAFRSEPHFRDSRRSNSETIHSPADLVKHKRTYSQCQDEPIDLSCKPKKGRPEGPPSCDSPLSRRLSWGSEYQGSSGAPDGSSTANTDSFPRKSILESILCATKDKCDTSSPGLRTSRKDSFPFDLMMTPTSASSDSRHPSSVPTSPLHGRDSPLSNTSLPISMPPSPALSVGSQYGLGSPRPRCPWRQQVTLAKKNLYPVRARVSDWFLKIMAFAKSRQEFTSLPETDQVTLIQNAWTRLMLIHMAENNFHCVVTPVHEDSDDGRPPAISGIDPSEPTMDSVEVVQNFIRKCQALGLENIEYGCLRMVTLFHTGCPGLENADFVDKISSAARQTLQETVLYTHPGDRLRYSNLLLCLHTLFGVNTGMVQTLFCKHLATTGSLEDEVKLQILKREPTDSDPELTETNT